MKKLHLLVIGLVVLGLVLGGFGCAAPKPVPTTPTAALASFEGKTITFIVAVSPGGGTDILARVYSMHLSRFLPGKPTIIVRNMPGAAGTIGGNYVYESAKPDGLTVLVGSGSPMLSDLMRLKAARYELVKMSATLGATMSNVFYIRPGIIDKPEDLPRAKGIIYGDTSGASGRMFIAAKELLNIPTEKVILAYSGTGDARRGFESGETNMASIGTPGYIETIIPLVAKGEVMPAFQAGLLDEKGNLVRDPGLPPIPTLKEIYETLQGKAPSGIAWESYKAMVAAGGSYDKVLFLPPGTPDSIVRAYWAACEAMVKDTEFRKIADPLIGKGGKWMAGEALDKEFKLNWRVDPKVVEWLKGTMKKYGIVVE